MKNTKGSPVYDVGCPLCRVKPGQYCRAGPGRHYPEFIHESRFRAWLKAWQKNFDTIAPLENNGDK